MRKLGDSDNGIMRTSEKNRLPIVKARDRAESDGAHSHKDCEDLQSMKSCKSSRSQHLDGKNQRKALHFEAQEANDLNIDSNETLSNFPGIEYANDENEETSHLQSKSGTNTQSHSYDIYDYSNIFFATERINLPRGKVVKEDSVRSSPSHGFRRGGSPGGEDEQDDGRGDGEVTGPGVLSPGKVCRGYMD